MLKADVCLVTGYRELGRSEWEHFARPTSWYFQAFERMLTLKAPIVVFMDAELMARAQAVIVMMGVEHRVKLAMWSDSFMPKELIEHREWERARMLEPEYQQWVAHRSECPETHNADYNFVNHAKVSLVNRAAKLVDPGHEYYAWVDFGYFRDASSLPDGNEVLFSPAFLQSDVTFVARDWPLTHEPQKYTPRALVRSGDVFVTGPFWLVRGDKTQALRDVYLRELEVLRKEGVADDDQTVLTQIVSHPTPGLTVGICIGPDPVNWFWVFNTPRQVKNRFDWASHWASYGSGQYIEVGVWKGEFIAYVAMSTDLKCLGIDPYAWQPDYQDAINEMGPEKFEEVYQEAASRLSDLGSLLRVTSEEAGHACIDESAAVVYIDGNHSYAAVLADLKLWWSKVQPGGLLCGDDAVDDPTQPYNERGNQRREWATDSWGEYGVRKAVDEFAVSIGLAAQYVGAAQWVIRKPYALKG